MRRRSSALTSLNGLESLTYVSRYLSIENNDALSDMTGLEGLTEVGNLYIWENDALTSLEGLAGITNIRGRLAIFDNPALPTCLAEELAYDIIGAENIGSISIHDNSDECPE